MRTAALLSSVFLISISALAGEVKPPAAADSPLVAAAKRSHRLGKKPAFVITNENMSSIAGPARMTSTDHVPVPVLVPPPRPAVPDAPPPKPAPVVSESERARRVARTAAMSESAGENLYSDPDVEGLQETAGDGKPSTTGSNPPHASTNTTTPNPKP